MLAAVNCCAPRLPRRHRIVDPVSGRACDVIESSPDLCVEFLAPLGDRLRAALAEDADGHGVGRAAELVGALPLGESTFERVLSPSLAAALTSGHDRPAGAVAAANLVQVIALTDRIASWAQAVQTQAMAAVARPGVAAPISDLLDLTTHGGRVSPDGSDPSDILSDNDFEATCFDEVSVAGTPDWDVLVREEATSLASAEVGVALALPPVTAAARLAESVDLVDGHPRVLECWQAGRIDRQRVRAFSGRTAGLDAVIVSEVEAALLSDGGGRAGSTTCVTLRRRLEREIARWDPSAGGRRKKLARASRGVFVQRGDDGMSRFCVDLPAPVALLAHEVMDTVARGLPASAGAGRTAAQLRADVFADIVTQLAAFGRLDLRSCPAGNSETGDAADDPGGPENLGDVDSGADRLLPVGWEALGASVSVVVDADVFSGCASDDLDVLEHALLERHGDIPADLARALAVSARRARLLTADTPARPLIPENAAGPEQASLGAGDRTAAVADAVADSLSRFCSLDGKVPHAGAPLRSLDAGRAERHRKPEGEPPLPLPPPSPPTEGRQIGHWAYRPDRETAERVVHRDRVCRFPGCRRPARQCDLDHRIPYDEGGPSTYDNLDVLCRFHHRIKTHAGWRAIRLPGNRMRWTSPLGAELIDEPELELQPRRSADSGVRPPAGDLQPPPF